jgi:hypothetical protein
MLGPLCTFSTMMPFIALVAACGPFPDDPDTPGPIVAPAADSAAGRHVVPPPVVPDRGVEATPKTRN